MRPLRALLAVGSLSSSASALAQHHRTGDAQSFEARGASRHGVVQQHHEASHHSRSVDAPSLWTTCSEVNSFDGLKPVDEARCLDANLIFLRIHKTGTSSMGGVLRRIAARRGLNGVAEKTPEGMPEPLVSTEHFFMAQWEEQPFVQEIKNFSKPNIIVTLLRDPVERWLSLFYYRVSKAPKPQGPFDLLEFLQTYARRWPNYQANFLSNKGSPYHPEREDGSVDVDELLQNYPLVGITERFQESVIALTFELGIDSLCDVLYMDAKVSANALNKNGKPFQAHVPFNEQPDEIKNYIQSPEFQMSMASDKELYAKANERLDYQIDNIGKERFEERLNEYEKWLKQAQETCGGETSDDSDCYFRDLGCKVTCLDQLCAAHAEELKLDRQESMFGREDLFPAPLILNH